MADRLFGTLARGAALLTLALLLGILGSLLVGAWPAIEKYGLGFLTSSGYHIAAESNVAEKPMTRLSFRFAEMVPCMES